MQRLETRRVRFSKEADNWLRVLKSRTGVTPNLLCRFGFCLSLEEPSLPDPLKYPEDSDREINRYTLLGEYESVFLALLRQRLAGSKGSTFSLDEQFRAHMNRGVILLAGRLRSLSELAPLLKATDKKASI